MKAVCAWCQRDLGERPGPADAITHGICSPCSDNFLSDGLVAQRSEQAIHNRLAPGSNPGEPTISPDGVCRTGVPAPVLMS